MPNLELASIDLLLSEPWFDDSSLQTPASEIPIGFMVSLEEGYLQKVTPLFEFQETRLISENWPVPTVFSNSAFVNGHLVRFKPPRENWEDLQIDRMSFFLPITGTVIEEKSLSLVDCAVAKITYQTGHYHLACRGHTTVVNLLKIVLFFENSCTIEAAQDTQVDLLNLLLIGLKTCGSPIQTVYTTTKNIPIYQFGASRLWLRNTLHLDEKKLSTDLAKLLAAYPLWLKNKHLSAWRYFIEHAYTFKFESLLTYKNQKDTLINMKSEFDAAFDFFEGVLRSIAEATTTGSRFRNISDALTIVDNCDARTVQAINQLIPCHAYNTLCSKLHIKADAADSSSTKLNKILRRLTILRNKSHHTFLSNSVQCDALDNIDFSIRQEASEFLTATGWLICLWEVLGLYDCGIFDVSYNRMET